MDLLGGYGSDAEASDGEPAPTPSIAAPASPPKPALASLPAEANGDPALLAKLPAPKSRARKAVQLRIPINVAPDSDDEEERPKKKAKPSSKGMSLAQFLPPPQHSAAAEPSTKGLLGAGYAQGAEGRSRLYDSDEEMAAPDPYRSEVVLGPAGGAAEGGEGAADADGASELYGAMAGGGQAYPGHGEAAGAPAQDGPLSGDQMLSAALQEEALKASKAGASLADPFAGVQFKEIKQAKLTYMPPEQREARNATRTAFGADYESRVRAEAGPQPEKLARRRHQIQSLYHQAKMKELEMMEMRGQAVKTRKETQAKYGWS